MTHDTDQTWAVSTVLLEAGKPASVTWRSYMLTPYTDPERAAHAVARHKDIMGPLRFVDLPGVQPGERAYQVANSNLLVVVQAAPAPDPTAWAPEGWEQFHGAGPIRVVREEEPPVVTMDARQRRTNLLNKAKAYRKTWEVWGAVVTEGLSENTDNARTNMDNAEQDLLAAARLYAGGLRR